MDASSSDAVARRKINRRQKLLKLREARRRRRDSQRDELVPGAPRDTVYKKDVEREIIMLQMRLPSIKDLRPPPIEHFDHYRKTIGTVPRLGIVPPLNLKDALEQQGKQPLHNYERQRNLYLSNEHEVRDNRQSVGRVNRAIAERAATKLQAIFRGKAGQKTVHNVLLEIEQQKKEEEEAKQRKLAEKRRAKEAAKWKKKVDELPESPLKDILYTINSSKSRYDLELEHWGVGPAVAREQNKVNVLSALGTFTGARKIRFWRCVVKNKFQTDLDGKQLADGIVHQEKLEELYLENCNLNAFDLQKVLGAVHYGCRKCLRVLSIKENFLSRGKWEGIDAKGRPTYEQAVSAGEVLGNCIRNISSLRHVDMSYNFMGGLAFRSIVMKSSEIKTNLLHLDLSFNNLTYEDCHFLSHMVCSCVNLTSVDVSGNPLRGIGIQIIEPGIALHKSLQVLRMAKTDMQDRGGVLFAQVLKTNTYLKELDLSYNKITDVGMNEICSAIARQGAGYSLKELNLSGNKISHEKQRQTSCIEAFSYMLVKCRTLHVLRIQDINMFQPPKQVQKSKVGVFSNLQLLLDALKINNTLRVLDLRHNHLTAAVAKPLVAFKIVEQAKEYRKGLYIPKDRQELIAQIFAKHFDPKSMNAEKYANIIMRVLAFDADRRTILL